MITLELIGQIEILQKLPEDLARELLEKATVAPYAPGEIIVPAGQPFTFFGVLLEGQADAYLPEQEAEPRSIETFRPGTTVGEMALMTGQNAPVDVIATTPCRVLLVPVDLFHRWVRADPDSLRTFSRSVARRSVLVEQGVQAQAQAAAELDALQDPYGLSLTPDEPQRLLVINLRAGSLKYRYFDTEDETKSVEGQVEWIGEPRALQSHSTASGEYTFAKPQVHHPEAIEASMSPLDHPIFNRPERIAQNTALGQRDVNYSQKYTTPEVIDEEVMADIRSYAHLAPLHNPMHALAIECCQEVLPHATHVAVFDTAFHQTMPPHAYRYALPEELY